MDGLVFIFQQCLVFLKITVKSEKTANKNNTQTI